MSFSKRKKRRTAGFLSKYFNGSLVGLVRSADGRSHRGRTWKNPMPLLKAALLGLASGCKGLGEVEELTKDMSKGARNLLGLPRAVPDTTLRTFLCKLAPSKLGDLVFHVGYDAWRRGALHQIDDFPFHAISMDGKYPSIRDVNNNEIAQVHHDDEGKPTHSLLRTITSTLVTAVGLPIIGVTHVPGETNEKGAFAGAFQKLVAVYDKLFQVVMYDAGVTSRTAADLVVEALKDYFFQVADPRWVMYQTMETLFARKKPTFVHEEKISEGVKTVRKITVLKVERTKKNITMWEHTNTAIKVESATCKHGEWNDGEVRYFVTSLQADVLSAEKWLKLVVRRWGVETCHQILDLRSAFDEDKRPWITCAAQGTLAVQLLRRVVYTLMTLYRHITLRNEDDKHAPWRRHMTWIKDTLTWPLEEAFENLRVRSFAVSPALQ